MIKQLNLVSTCLFIPFISISFSNAQNHQVTCYGGINPNDSNKIELRYVVDGRE